MPEEKSYIIYRSFAKLDKEPWENVRKELVEVKGLDNAIAIKLDEYIKLKGEPL